MPNSEAKKASNRAYSARRYARTHGKPTGIPLFPLIKRAPSTQPEAETADREAETDTTENQPRNDRESRAPNAWESLDDYEGPLPVRQPVAVESRGRRQASRVSKPKKESVEESSPASAYDYAISLVGGSK